MKYATAALTMTLALALAFAAPNVSAQSIDWNAAAESAGAPLQLEPGWLAQGAWSWGSSLRWTDAGSDPALQQTLALSWRGLLNDEVDTRVTVGRISGGGQMSPFVRANFGFEGARFQFSWSERDWAGSVRWNVFPGLTVQMNVLSNRPQTTELAFARDCPAFAGHCF